MGMRVQAPATRGRRISCLLAGTALVGAAALPLSSIDANATCIGTSNSVSCSSDTTTTDTPGSGPSDRHYTFTSGIGNGVVAAGVIVDGFGLAFTGVPNASVNVSNSGTVVLNAGTPTAGGDGAVRINQSGLGSVFYGGAGAITANAGFGDALVISKTGAGSVIVTNDGTIQSVSGNGVRGTFEGAFTVQGSGAISGGTDGVNVQSTVAGNINIIGSGAISGSGGTGVVALSAGGNVLVATTNTISGGTGIDARTIGTGTATVTTGGAVTATSVTGTGINTVAVNGTTTVNIAHDVSATGTNGVGVRSDTSGSGLIDINHTGGTISGLLGIQGIHSGSGTIDISQTSGAINATGAGGVAVSGVATSSANIIVSLTGGTVGAVNNNAINTNAQSGTTNITTDVNLTATVGSSILARSTSGAITVQGSGSIGGGTHGIDARASGAGNVNVIGSGAISGNTGVLAQSTGGNVQVATGSTVSGGIVARTDLSGTVTVTTGGAVTNTGEGIFTRAANGTTTVNVLHDVSGGGGSAAIVSNGLGSGLIDINHTAGTIGGASIGIFAAQTGSGAIDISQIGGALNGTSRAVDVSMTGSGNVTVSLTGGTVGNTSGNAVQTSATTGTTNITTNVNLTSTGANGISASSTAGTININGSGTVSGEGAGVEAMTGSGNINITGSGSITGVTGPGIVGFSNGGNVLIATGSTVSGESGIFAFAGGSGTVTITTGGAVTGTTQEGISTQAANGNTTVNVGHNVTAGPEGIRSSGNGSGLIDINHTAGTIAAGAFGIRATQTGIGTIDISQTGGALNGTTNAVIAQATGTGNVIVSLTGGTVGNVSGNAITTSATTGSTTITTGVAITSTGANAINATATSGNIGITNSSTVNGATNAVFGSTSGTFNITNNGVLFGSVNVTGSNVATSTFANPGAWNAGNGNSSFSGNFSNTGTLNAQNAAAGQVIAIAGNYTGSGAYRVDVDAAGNADRVNIGGTATLTGGSVNALFLSGAYISRNYTILSATGGLGSTTFTAGLTTTNLPAGFVASLAYTPTDVLLNLAAFLGTGANLNQNQQNVANTINSYFNNGGALPPGFVTVFGLSGSALNTALTQLSGEHATGLQPAANLSTGMFLASMLDPFVTGRSGGFGAAMGYAPDTPSRVAVAARDAFAADMPVKAPVPYIVEQRWTVWGSAYGGRNRTDGDAVVGSNNLTASAAGFAAGADYRVSPGSVVGMAVAIGETRWNVSGVGKGDADVAQIGGYASTRWDALYVSGAVALAWHRASTDRTLTIAGTDRLEADFNATSFGGRLEGGYRYGSGNLGLTPYAAVQITGIHTSSYNEVATSGSNQFALSYREQSTNDIRSELGFWADTRHAFGNGALVTLRGRAAWVHDYNPGSRIQAAFQTLPGTSFVVGGAAAPRDAALTSAVAEMRFSNGVTLIGKFDGEFSDRSHTLAGTGTLRYAW